MVVTAHGHHGHDVRCFVVKVLKHVTGHARTQNRDVVVMHVMIEWKQLKVVHVLAYVKVRKCNHYSKLHFYPGL